MALCYLWVDRLTFWKLVLEVCILNKAHMLFFSPLLHTLNLNIHPVRWKQKTMFPRDPPPPSPPPVGSIYFFSRCKSGSWMPKNPHIARSHQSRSFIPSIHCIRQTTNSLHTITLAATESAWILQLCNLQIIDSINIFAWYRNLISRLSIFPVGLLRLRTNY